MSNYAVDAYYLGKLENFDNLKNKLKKELFDLVREEDDSRECYIDLGYDSITWLERGGYPRAKKKILEIADGKIRIMSREPYHLPDEKPSSVSKDIDYTIACAGQQIEFDGVVIEVLNPQGTLLHGTESDIDNNSVVLHVNMDDISFLLTADLMWQGELELISRRLIPECTVLKVGHHGSVTSTTTEFLATVNPQMAVISADPQKYGHPSDEVVARLEAELGAENIYITDEDGTIEFITDGKRLWVKLGG